MVALQNCGALQTRVTPLHVKFRALVLAEERGNVDIRGKGMIKASVILTDCQQACTQDLQIERDCPYSQ